MGSSNELHRTKPGLTPAPVSPAAPPRRDQLNFPAQLLLWSWRVLRRAYPHVGPVATRVSRTYDILGAPRAFPALHALACLHGTNPQPAPPPLWPGNLGIAPGEHLLLNAIRHLQRGNDQLGRQALGRLIDEFRLDLALHDGKTYACEMAAIGHVLYCTAGQRSVALALA